VAARVLNLYSNQLTGAIPESLGLLAGLTWVVMPVVDTGMGDCQCLWS
jgi:hypothetical protein